MNAIHTVFFDLDGTLYPERNGLWLAIKERIDSYLLQRMGFPAAEVARVRQRYLRDYGTTLRGLQVEHQVDSAEYLAYVHDVPLERYLSPDPRLRTMLETLARPKWVLTNSDMAHARRVLDIIGITACFDGIIDIYRLDFVCKPDPEAYQKALEVAGLARSAGCLLVEDSPDNLQTAKKMGFYTVLVNHRFESHYAADHTIHSIHQLAQALPWLWNGRA